MSTLKRKGESTSPIKQLDSSSKTRRDMRHNTISKTVISNQSPFTQLYFDIEGVENPAISFKSRQ